MATLETIYGRIASIADASADGALAAALPTADAAALPWIVKAILARSSVPGKLALVMNWHRLDADLKAAVAVQVAELESPVRMAMGEAGSHGPDHAVAIIRQTKAAPLAYLLSERLRHGRAEGKQQAAEALLELAMSIVTDPSDEAEPLRDSTEVGFITTAVEDAIVHYGQHQQPAVLLAMLVLAPRPLPLAMLVLQQQDHPAVPTLRRLLTRAEHPAVQRSMFMLMATPTLGDVIRDVITRLGWGRGIGPLLASSHLLLKPAIAQAARRIDGWEPSLPDDQEIQAFPVHQTRGLARWIAALPLETAQRVEALARLNCIQDPLARLSALRQLMALAPQTGGAGAYEVIGGYCSDPQRVLARIALRFLIDRRWPGLPKLLPKLINSPHGSVRALAAQHLAPIAFDRLWESWPRLDEAGRLSAGKALIKIDPAFHRRIGQRLTILERKSRLRALSMIHVLNQGELFESALLSLIRDGDVYVVASTARALGTVHTQAAREALENALLHEDARVRANSIEALEQMGTHHHIARLLEIAQTDENRPRANAIRALMHLSTSEAVDALRTMLADASASQRQSALWLVENLGLLTLARQVAEMSITDPDRSTKDRANHVIHQLVSQGTPAAPTIPLPAGAAGPALTRGAS